jgi:hypothetical protein
MSIVVQPTDITGPCGAGVRRTAVVDGDVAFNQLTIELAGSAAGVTVVSVMAELPSNTIYNAGDYTVRFQVITANMNITWANVAVDKINDASLCSRYTNDIIRSVFTTNQLLSATGVYSATFSGDAPTGASTLDKVKFEFRFSNGAMTAQSVTIRLSQQFDTPFTLAILGQGAYRARNDDGNETGATWKAALNTPWPQQGAEIVRVRTVVDTNYPLTTAFGWQYGELLGTYSTAIPGLPPLSDDILDAVFSPGSGWLAMATRASPGILILNTSGWTSVSGLPTYTSSGGAVAFSPDGTRLALGREIEANPANLLTIFDTANWSTVSGTPAVTGGIQRMAFSPNGTWLAVGTSESLHVFNTSDWLPVSGLPTLDTWVWGLEFSPDSTKLAVGHDVLTIFDTSNWSTVSGTPTLSSVGRLAFNPSGTQLAIASTNLYVLNTSNWSTVPGTPTIINPLDIAFDPTGTRIAIAHSASPYLTVVDTTNWSSVPNTYTPSKGGRVVTFSSNGYWLVCGYMGFGVPPYYDVIDGVTWLAMPAQATSGVPVRYANSTHVTDAGTTTQQISTGTFVGGRIYESAHTNTVALTADDKTELEAVIEVVDAEIAIGDRIMFRVVKES